MKDPAILFYTGDFLNGCTDLTFEERGQYITLLCLQHQKGHLSEKTIRLSVGSINGDVIKKFLKDEQGNFYNARMDEEIAKRQHFLDTRYFNGKKGGRPLKANNKPNIKANNKPTQNLSENENENENINVIEERKKVFDNFRKDFPGTRKGLESEFENFTKHHKDWKEVLPVLSDRLNYQKEARQVRKDNKLFVPEWKNLQTWINQRCWEDIINTTE
jgi:uncharacterized protein YdaU (DUF1376 family)